MIAFQMNGAQLPMLNGFPLRLVVPGWYSTYWVKALDRIEVLDAPDTGYLDGQGLSHPGPRRARTSRPARRISRPCRSTGCCRAPSSPRADAAGRARDRDGRRCRRRAGRGVDRRRRTAGTLRNSGRDHGPYGFRRWAMPLTGLPRGAHEIAVRTTNTRGEAQKSDADLEPRRLYAQQHRNRAAWWWHDPRHPPRRAAARARWPASAPRPSEIAPRRSTRRRRSRSTLAERSRFPTETVDASGQRRDPHDQLHRLPFGRAAADAAQARRPRHWTAEVGKMRTAYKATIAEWTTPSSSRRVALQGDAARSAVGAPEEHVVVTRGDEQRPHAHRARRAAACRSSRRPSRRGSRRPASAGTPPTRPARPR